MNSEKIPVATTAVTTLIAGVASAYGFFFGDVRFESAVVILLVAILFVNISALLR